MMTKKSVLIVDDNGFIINLVKNALRNSSMKTMGASSVKNARMMILKLLPDVIILDRKLPDEDGHTLLSDLRKDHRTRHIPVLMLSAENHLDEVKTSLSLGANDYLVKPFKNGVLVKKIQRLINNATPDIGEYFYVG